VLLQEERFLAAVVEDERVAPLETRHELALAGLLGNQVADGLLRHRLRRRRADVDELGAPPRVEQQPRRHQVVVDDDVGPLQAGEPVHGDEPRVAGTRADERNRGLFHDDRELPA
jgi:hypothetical protein